MKIEVPGPTSSLLGLDFAGRFKADPLGTATSLHRDYGDIVRLRLGPLDWYMVVHPEQVKDVLVTRSREFGKTEQFKRILSTVDGNGLVISEGDFWLRQRRIIQPVFHHDVLGEYVHTIIGQTRKWLDKWKVGSPMNLADELTNITLTIAAQIFLGVEVDADARTLGNAVTTISKCLYLEFTQAVPLPEWLPIPSKIEKRNAVTTLDAMIEAAIRRAESSPESSGNMLGRLLLARDPEGGATMTRKEVRDEAITMFNAGHDSTASTLAWAFYLLLKHPAVLTEMVEQLRTHGGSDQVNVETINKIPLALQVAKETMRLYPAAWTIPRQANHDLEIAGYSIKKGSIVNLFPFVTQHDARFWNNPEAFEPGRFALENEHSIVPFSWFPFGAGPRSCIGRDFALMEIQLIMLTILQRFRFEFVSGKENVEMNPIVSLEPKDGVWVIPQPR